MNSKEAREWAGSAWCQEATKNKIMDPDLAFAFADILEKIVNQELRAAEIKAARDVFDRHLRDEELYHSYLSNIAVAITDSGGEYSIAQKAAERILSILFQEPK